MDIIEEIRSLKAERKALVLAHNYVRPELQELAEDDLLLFEVPGLAQRLVAVAQRDVVEEGLPRLGLRIFRVHFQLLSAEPKSKKGADTKNPPGEAGSEVCDKSVSATRHRGP